MMRSWKAFLAVSCFLLVSATPGLANPGGEGDGDRDFSCAESCHVGAQGERSSGSISLTLDRDRVFAGQLFSVSATVVDTELSSNGLVGVFLLDEISGNSGSNVEDGTLEIVQDPNGGHANYVERRLISSGGGAVFTWTLRAPVSLGPQTVSAAMHHGEDSADTAMFNTAQVLQFEVESLPDDLPRLKEGWEAPSIRHPGEETTIILDLEDTDVVFIEWKPTAESSPVALQVEELEKGFSFTIPGTTDESEVSWRATLSNAALSEKTPWFTLHSKDPELEVDETSLYIQALSYCLLSAAVCIIIQKKAWRRAHSTEIPPMLDLDDILPLPATGLPHGWTDEQWRHYGHQYLQQMEAER